MKKIKILVCISIFMTGCTDFLEQDSKETNYGLFNDAQGMEYLVQGAYSFLRYKQGGEQSFTLWEYGVDTYTHAADGQHKYFDRYESQLNPSAAGYIAGLWAANYRAINTCNTGIERIPSVNASSGIYTTEEGKNQRIAELRFLRALYHMQLVQQFGSIPLQLKSTEGVQTAFSRSPVADIYNAIISDFRFAESILPETQSDNGRVTKGAAAHFAAKAYLTRASAVTEQRGTKPTDLDSAIYFAEQVITSGDYSLVPDYKDLWPVENEANGEVIFAAQNDNTLLLQDNDRSNEVHLYFNFPYDNEKGMKRDIANGRPWRRLRMTNYATDLFDRKNDSRFYKSLKTTWFSNNGDNLPTWPADHWDAAKAGKEKFGIGDTSIVYSLHKYIPASLKAQIPPGFAPNGANNSYDTANYLMPYLWIYRNYEGTDELSYSDQRFLVLAKHLDPTRLTVSTEFSQRDAWLARLAETYLIAAEAHGRKNNYVTATKYINDLRFRAAYKDGEAKPLQFHFGEGGTKGDVTGTYDDIKLPEDGSYWDTNVALEQYPPSAGSKESRFIHFILNERARELLGELYRWDDLQRTETLVERAQLFNPRAKNNIKAFHKLRPIPQSHIDAITNASGLPLSDEERGANQNPGY